jgi:preprotein translocase subunit SecB
LETNRKVDLAAVARIARRVDLKDICLTEITASSCPRVQGTLEADLKHECLAKRLELNAFEVNCRYAFTVKTTATEVASASFNYTILYHVSGDEAVADDDLGEFAFANGIYHSWPFVRQLLFDLTARMGYAPYTLPVMKFNPKPAPVQPTEGVKVEPASS